MSNQRISDRGSAGKYYHQILNIDDDDLDPYQYRLLGHYRRRCGDSGVCFETVETTAQITKMGINKVRSTRKWLQEHHYIETVQKSGGTIDIELLDRMPENIQRCSNYPSLIRDHPLTDPLPLPLTDPLGKEEPSKEDPKKNPSAKAEKRPKKEPKYKPSITFNRLALECLSLSKEQINGHGGQVATILYGKDGENGWQGLWQLVYGDKVFTLEKDIALEQELANAFAHYRKIKPNLSVPTSSGTIWKMLSEFRSAKKPRATSITPLGNGATLRDGIAYDATGKIIPPVAPPRLPPIHTKKEPEYDF